MPSQILHVGLGRCFASSESTHEAEKTVPASGVLRTITSRKEPRRRSRDNGLAIRLGLARIFAGDSHVAGGELDAVACHEKE